MAGDPAAGGGGGAHPASGGKGSRSSTRHRQFRDRAKTRVDDLQEMFSGLQSARKESRSADAAVLEEQVHQMLREWRAELSVPSPASSLQNSQGNNREASDPPSETLRLLQLAVAEEEDDATSKLMVPRSPLQVPASHQTHEHLHGQDSRMPNPDQRCESVAGGAAPAQQSLDQAMQGDCGEGTAAVNAMFNDQVDNNDMDVDGPAYDGGSSSSSEDEITAMCRRNLKMAQDMVVQLIPILGMYSENYFDKQSRRKAGESGLQWVLRTLARDNSCYNMFRVERPLFNRLHNTLVQSYGLQSTCKMSSVEALAMFLWIVGAPQSVRQAEDRFVRSMETVSRTFDNVLSCILRLAPDIIKPRDPNFTEVHPNLENPDFWPHFNDCIGAIDGTHIKVVVPKSKRIQYLNRHNETSQNVLAVCDFDMRFTFVLSGWPGSVHDMRVFKDAMTTHYHKFPHPPEGKYYVVDAGYPNRPGYLSPYRCTRYHVEQWQNGPPPQGMKETFNHAHSQVRNVIERSFGVLKMKWRMLLNMPKFSEQKQTRIIVACMALHNFIRESRIADREFGRCDADANYFPMSTSTNTEWPEDEPLVEDTTMNGYRDELAHALFHGL